MSLPKIMHAGQYPQKLHEPSSVASAHRLIYLLERLSADSHWAHRASGLRGALLRAVSEYELTMLDHNPASIQQLNTRLDLLIQAGYEILTIAARDIRTPELIEFLRD
jgi:hypothetical protein